MGGLVNIDWTIRVSDVAIFVSVGLAYLNFRWDRRKILDEQAELRERTNQAQVTMHVQNQHKLDALLEYHHDQLEINNKCNQQIGQLEKLGEVTSAILDRVEQQMRLFQERVMYDRRKTPREEGG